jgi:hypothetical protein
MPGHQYTQAEYALQRVVESFGTLLFELAEHDLTHTYAVVFRLCQLENIHYLVLRYLNTGTLPFKGYSEEWLFDGEVYSSSTSETAIATILIWISWKLLRWN